MQYALNRCHLPMPTYMLIWLAFPYKLLTPFLQVCFLKLEPQHPARLLPPVLSSTLLPVVSRLSGLRGVNSSFGFPARLGAAPHRPGYSPSSSTPRSPALYTLPSPKPSYLSTKYLRPGPEFSLPKLLPIPYTPS